MGPFLGNALFKLRYRQQWGQIAAVSFFFSIFLSLLLLGGRDGEVVGGRERKSNWLI